MAILSVIFSFVVTDLTFMLFIGQDAEGVCKVAAPQLLFVVPRGAQVAGALEASSAPLVPSLVARCFAAQRRQYWDRPAARRPSRAAGGSDDAVLNFLGLASRAPSESALRRSSSARNRSICECPWRTCLVWA